jgi:uncharacterized membrane protein YdjX (TVP38/TMEM64 family)
MFRCPHCGKAGIPPLRKVILSPGFTATCNSCGGLSGLRYSSWLTAMLPGTVLMIVALFVGSETAEWSLNIIGLIMMIILPFLFTPLHKENWLDPASVEK